MRRLLSVGLAAWLGAAGPRAVAQDVARARQTAIVSAAARLAPAVVSVNVLRRERRLPADPFDQFFMPRGAEQIVEGYGSGFVVSSDGVVITNQHVSQGAEQIVITTRDGRDFPAKLLGEDPLTDIAVLKINGSDLPIAPLGKSTDLQIGEWVVAVGHPFAYLLGNTEPTVTRRGGCGRPARLEAGRRAAGDAGGGERTGGAGGDRGGRCATGRPGTSPAHVSGLGGGAARHRARRHPPRLTPPRRPDPHGATHGYGPPNHPRREGVGAGRYQSGHRDRRDPCRAEHPERPRRAHLRHPGGDAPSHRSAIR